MREALLQVSEQETQIAGILRANVYTQARLSWGMNFLLLLVGYGVLQNFALNAPLSLWAAMGVAVFLLRLPSVVNASRLNAPSVSKLFYLFGLFLCGSVWGAFAFVSLPVVQNEVPQTLVFALPMLVCMVSLMTLSSWLPAFHAFVWPLAVPFLATLALHADGAYQTMLPVAACFIGFCILFAHLINRQARKQAMLQIQNTLYMQELADQNLQFNRARVQAVSDLEELRKAQSVTQSDSTGENLGGTSLTTTPMDAPVEDELAFLDSTLKFDVGEQSKHMSAA